MGLLRHCAVMICPGASLPISISTGPAATLARSLGSMDSTNGTAVATTPTAPIVDVVLSSSRRCLSGTAGGWREGVSVCSLMTGGLGVWAYTQVTTAPSQKFGVLP